MNDFPESSGPDMPDWYISDDLSGQPDESLPYDPSAVDGDLLRSAEDSDEPVDAAEVLYPTPRDVRSLCLEEAAIALSDVTEPDTFGESVPKYRPNAIGDIFADMAADAAAKGDAEEVDRTIGLLNVMPFIPSRAFVKACFAGIEIESELSYDALGRHLFNEQYSSREKLAEAAEKGVIGRVPIQQPGLKNVTDECLARGTSPEAWIRTYAADPEAQWELFADYFAKAAQGDDENAAYYKTQLDRTVSVLLEDGYLSPGFQRDAIQAGLEYTDDPELRDSLVSRYMNIVTREPLRWDSFQKLVQVGAEVVNDDNLATYDRLEDFVAIIEECSRSFNQMGVPAHDVIMCIIDFDVALARRSNVDPQVVIAELDSIMANILDTSLPAHKMTSEIITDTRDRKVGELAHYAFTHGNTANAATYLSSITQEAQRAHAVKGCLEAATTATQVQALRPDAHTLSNSPDLGFQFAYAEARLAEDTAALYDLAALYAQDLGNVANHDTAISYIGQSFEAIAASEPARALALAREVLPPMRAAGATYAETRYLSDVLIAAGDQYEPQQAYESVTATSPDRSARVKNLWNLARTIKAAQG